MRKMVIRADDVGYTDVCNIGTFLTITDGVVTSADVMLESPGTEDALRRLKELPWISIGWHSHFWCSPVLPASQVPSLVIPETGRFRHDLTTAADIDAGELEAECHAQMKRCLTILGRAPDTTDLTGQETVFNAVKKKICDEYGIAYHFATKGGRTGVTYPLDKWAGRKIHIPAPTNAYREIETDSLTAQMERYDPVKYYTEDPDKILELPDDVIFEQSWHPGYVDYFVYKQGDYGPHAKEFTSVRTEDVAALTSDRLRAWIRENRIELINFRDALYGTSEYQNHLRSIDSDLFVGNM